MRDIKAEADMLKARMKRDGVDVTFENCRVCGEPMPCHAYSADAPKTSNEESGK